MSILYEKKKETLKGGIGMFSDPAGGIARFNSSVASGDSGVATSSNSDGGGCCGESLEEETKLTATYQYHDTYKVDGITQPEVNLVTTAKSTEDAINKFRFRLAFPNGNVPSDEIEKRSQIKRIELNSNHVTIKSIHDEIIDPEPRCPIHKCHLTTSGECPECEFESVYLGEDFMKFNRIIESKNLIEDHELDEIDSIKNSDLTDAQKNTILRDYYGQETLDGDYEDLPDGVEYNVDTQELIDYNKNINRPSHDASNYDDDYDEDESDEDDYQSSNNDEDFDIKYSLGAQSFLYDDPDNKKAIPFNRDPVNKTEIDANGVKKTTYNFEGIGLPKETVEALSVLYRVGNTLMNMFNELPQEEQEKYDISRGIGIASVELSRLAAYEDWAIISDKGSSLGALVLSNAMHGMVTPFIPFDTTKNDPNKSGKEFNRPEEIKIGYDDNGNKLSTPHAKKETKVDDQGNQIRVRHTLIQYVIPNIPAISASLSNIRMIRNNTEKSYFGGGSVGVLAKKKYKTNTDKFFEELNMPLLDPIYRDIMKAAESSVEYNTYNKRNKDSFSNDDVFSSIPDNIVNGATGIAPVIIYNKEVKNWVEFIPYSSGIDTPGTYFKQMFTFDDNARAIDPLNRNPRMLPYSVKLDKWKAQIIDKINKLKSADKYAIPDTFTPDKFHTLGKDSANDVKESFKRSLYPIADEELQDKYISECRHFCNISEDVEITEDLFNNRLTKSLFAHMCGQKGYDYTDTKNIILGNYRKEES